MKRIAWMSISMALIAGAFMQSAHAAVKHIPVSAKSVERARGAGSEEGAEQGLDLSLRSKAAAMPLVTADGSALETPASHVYLVDFNTGTVLASKAADNKMYPSSMTKMLTLYIVFDHLKQGTLSTDSQFTVSQNAWKTGGSRMFLNLNDQVSLENLIRGVAIQSGNDACVTIAEGLAGSEASFAGQMNEQAKKLGMNSTHFMNSDGLPDPEHYTSVHDRAVLATALIRDFPQYYHYVSEREFTYHGIRQFNRNLLLGNSALHVDGLKTGHTDAAGYGITLSAKDPVTGRRLVLVVNGLDSEKDRAAEGERLLNWGFHNFDDLVLFKDGAKVMTAKVWGGHAQEVALVPASNVVMSIPKVGREKITMSATYSGPLVAPIEKGKQYGTLTITMANGEKHEVPLVAAASVEKLSFFGRLGRMLGM